MNTETLLEGIAEVLSIAASIFTLMIGLRAETQSIAKHILLAKPLLDFGRREVVIRPPHFLLTNGFPAPIHLIDGLLRTGGYVIIGLK